MIKIIVLIVFIISLVAVAPSLIDDPGYMQIAFGGTVIESTVVAGVIMLTLIFIALMLTLKFFRGSLNFSFAAWNKIAYAGRRRALKDLNKGIAAYVLGDYKQAEHLLAKSAEASTFEHIAYLVAADAVAAVILRYGARFDVTQR